MGKKSNLFLLVKVKFMLQIFAWQYSSLSRPRKFPKNTTNTTWQQKFSFRVVVWDRDYSHTEKYFSIFYFFLSACDLNGPCSTLLSTKGDKVKWYKTRQWRNIRDASTPSGSYFIAEVKKVNALIQCMSRFIK